jgi:hypothetical protein
MSRSCDFAGAFFAYGVVLPSETFEILYEGDGTVLYTKDNIDIVMKIYGTDDDPRYFAHVGKCFRSGCFQSETEDESETPESRNPQDFPEINIPDSFEVSSVPIIEKDDEKITIEAMTKIQDNGHHELFKEFYDIFEVELDLPRWHCLFGLGNCM